VGATYQFAAQVQQSGTPVAGATVTWTSSNPAVATVSASGLVTAVASVGSATITASSSGVQTQTANVIVAQPSPGTVLVASSDVVTASPTAATVKGDSTTSTIKIGTIVVSGDKGGLFGRVTSVQTQGAEIALSLQPVALWQAFRQLDIAVTGAVVPVQVSLQHGRVTMSSHGRRLRDLDLGPFGCTDAGGASVNVEIQDPSITANVTAQLVATYKSTWTGGITEFQLYVATSVPITLTTGSATVSVAGQETVTCSADIPQVLLPGVLPLGPIDLVGPSINQSLDISINANANATLTVVGPQLTDTATLNDGVQYQDGAWQPIEQNTQSGPLLTPTGSQLNAAASLEIEPSYRIDIGTVATVFGIPLSTVQVAFGEVGANFSLALLSPVGDEQTGYTGPTWSADLDLHAGPELALSGGVLQDYLGVPSFSQQWALFNATVPLASSPMPILHASPTIVQSGAVALTAVVPSRYGGDQVEFIGFENGASTGSVLAQSAVNSNGTAAASWTPSAGAGTYAIVALLFDPTFEFGALQLPYASAPVTVSVVPGASPTPTARPTVSPSPSPTPTGSPSASPSATVPPGELYLSINDNDFGDNSGSWDVNITLSPGANHGVTYPGATEWMDSGLTLSAGQTVTFSATGLIYIGNVSAGQPNVSNYQSPAGDPSTTTAAEGGSFAAPGLVPWSLVGKVGLGGTPFEIGTGVTVAVRGG
jgi:hypothetical protein